MTEINRRKALKALGLGTAGAVVGGAAVAAGLKVSEQPAQTQVAQPNAAGAVTPVADASHSTLLPFEGVHQAGILTAPPEAVLLATINVTVGNNRDLVRLFKTISQRIALLTGGEVGSLQEDNADYPPENTGELGVQPLKDGRLSITLGLGASLFEKDGRDRFGLVRQKPAVLKPMPGDLAGDRLNSAMLGGDIFLQISSDHPLINLHALRDILRYTKGQTSPNWAQPGFQRYFDAPDGQAKARGLLGFLDGTSNLNTADKGLMDKLVWANAEEPQWARGGTYIAARIIREQIERWDRLTLGQQEASIGRTKRTGAPLGDLTNKETTTPNYASDPEGEQNPLNAHIRKANPRLGEESDKRRMLRRGYLYFNGIDKSGLLDAGFLFMGFCRNVEEQFEFVKRNYMTNRSFPKANTGVQDLDEYLFCVGGGYFFAPPGVSGSDRFLADSLLLS
jgi:deferrochelatase/peroxidase EfeB